jgi:hypothetical protein
VYGLVRHGALLYELSSALSFPHLHPKWKVVYFFRFFTDKVASKSEKINEWIGFLNYYKVFLNIYVMAQGYNPYGQQRGGTQQQPYGNAMLPGQQMQQEAKKFAIPTWAAWLIGIGFLSFIGWLIWFLFFR